MAMRSALLRLPSAPHSAAMMGTPAARAGLRRFSDEKGKLFIDEERAKEAVYIKKMERERLARLKKKLEELEKEEAQKGKSSDKEMERERLAKLRKALEEMEKAEADKCKSSNKEGEVSGNSWIQENPHQEFILYYRNRQKNQHSNSLKL